MTELPPKRWLHGEIRDMQRYVARVNGVRRRVLELTYWPVDWESMKPAPPDAYANIWPDYALSSGKKFDRTRLNKRKSVFGLSGRDRSLGGRGYVTTVGSFWCGTCAEIWVWIEVDGPIQRQRIHVRARGPHSR